MPHYPQRLIRGPKPTRGLESKAKQKVRFMGRDYVVRDYVVSGKEPKKSSHKGRLAEWIDAKLK